MLPELTMRTLRVVEEEDVIVPDLRVRRAMGGPLLRRVTAIAELGVVALTAGRAGNPQHVITACRSSCRCRSEERRVGKEGVSTGRYRWSPAHNKKKE